MTIAIANRAQLTAALSKAVGGETFVLAPGSYGSISIDDRHFKATVTIRSADAANQAKFSAFTIDESSNIALSSLDVGRAMQKHEKDYGKMVMVTDSRNISLDDMTIHGSLDRNSHNDGWGMLVSDSANVRVTRSDFTELHRGAVFQRSSRLTVEGNHFHHLRSDGVNFAAVEGVLVKDNRFNDFFFKGRDHPDAIQFWTAGTNRASANITITGNQIFQGSGKQLQGIFMRDELGHLPYKNVTIDNNLVYTNDHWHGIGINGVQGLSITNNTVVSRTGDKPHLWIKVSDASGVTIARNVTDEVLLMPDAGGKAYGNLELRGDAAATARIPHLNKGAATTVQDLLIDGYGYQPGGSSVPPPSPAPAPTPTPTPTPSPAPPPGGEIYGTSASQTVKGTAADDIIYGVGKNDAAPGDDSRDKLYGRGGADIFVFGDHRGVFYDNATSTASGRWDFAQIMDFGADDRIRLSGKASDYVFRRETVNGKVGTAIFKDDGDGVWDKPDELIGHVAGVTLSQSSLIFTGSPGRSGAMIEAESVVERPAAQALAPQPVEHVAEPGLVFQMEQMFAHHFAIA
jgi:hypothetical protein